MSVMTRILGLFRLTVEIPVVGLRFDSTLNTMIARVRSITKDWSRPWFSTSMEKEFSNRQLERRARGEYLARLPAAR